MEVYCYDTFTLANMEMNNGQMCVYCSVSIYIDRKFVCIYSCDLRLKFSELTYNIHWDWSVLSVDLVRVQVGNDQEMAHSERNSHFKNRGGKNKLTIMYLY